MILPERKKNRLKNFDYSDSGWYFVTICTKNRVECFGEVISKKMVLNKFGEIVSRVWFDLPNHYVNVELDEFIIMPNHIHGIIVIRNVGAKFISPAVSGDLKIAPTKKPSLSRIIKWYKSITSIEIRKTNQLFQWQKSFYDHIIRSEKSLITIQQYIRDNPRKWDDDQNNIENIYM